MFRRMSAALTTRPYLGPTQNQQYLTLILLLPRRQIKSPVGSFATFYLFIVHHMYVARLIAFVNNIEVNKANTSCSTHSSSPSHSRWSFQNQAVLLSAAADCNLTIPLRNNLEHPSLIDFLFQLAKPSGYFAFCFFGTYVKVGSSILDSTL
jgi:hypothetical protein